MNGVMDSTHSNGISGRAYRGYYGFLEFSFLFDAIPRVMETATVAARWAVLKQEAMRKVFESRVGEYVAR